MNVGGAVRSRRVPFTEDMTLLTAINAAGGFNDFADQKRVRVLRGSEVKVCDVRQFRKILERRQTPARRPSRSSSELLLESGGKRFTVGAITSR